jgi:hypothetical protein
MTERTLPVDPLTPDRRNGQEPEIDGLRLLMQQQQRQMQQMQEQMLQQQQLMLQFMQQQQQQQQQLPQQSQQQQQLLSGLAAAAIPVPTGSVATGGGADQSRGGLFPPTVPLDAQVEDGSRVPVFAFSAASPTGATGNDSPASTITLPVGGLLTGAGGADGRGTPNPQGSPGPVPAFPQQGADDSRRCVLEDKKNMPKMDILPKLSSTISTQDLQSYLEKMSIAFSSLSQEIADEWTKIVDEGKRTYSQFLKLPSTEQEKIRPTCVSNDRTLAIRPLLLATLDVSMYDLLIAERRASAEDAIFEILRTSKRGTAAEKKTLKVEVTNPPSAATAKDILVNVSSWKVARSKLIELGKDVTEEEVLTSITKLFAGLRLDDDRKHELRALRVAWDINENPSEAGLEALLDRYVTFARKLAAGDDKSAPPSAKFIDGVGCTICKKTNHTADKCYFKDKQSDAKGKGKGSGSSGGKGSTKGAGKGGSGGGKQQQQQQQQQSSPKRECTCCGRTGHVKADCFHKEKPCSYCSKIGHCESVCNKKKADQGTAKVPHSAKNASSSPGAFQKPAGSSSSASTPTLEEIERTVKAAMMFALMLDPCSPHAKTASTFLQRVRDIKAAAAQKPRSILDSGANAFVFPEKDKAGVLRETTVSTASGNSPGLINQLKEVYLGDSLPLIPWLKIARVLRLNSVWEDDCLYLIGLGVHVKVVIEQDLGYISHEDSILLRDKVRDYERRRLYAAMTSGVVMEELAPSLDELKPVTAEAKAHAEAGHIPYDKECPHCVAGAGRLRPHRRSDRKSDSLSFDVARPFPSSKGEGYRYALVGVLGVRASRWKEEVTAKSTTASVSERDEGFDAEFPEVSSPSSSDAAEWADGVFGSDDEDRQWWDDMFVPAKGAPAANPEVQEEQEEQVTTEEFRTRYLVAFMKTRGEVLSAMRSIHVRAKQMADYSRVHVDHGGEFRSKKVRSWAEEQSLVITFSSVAEPHSNGRAESAIGLFKKRSRTLLSSAGFGLDYWKFAFSYATTLENHARDNRALPAWVPEFRALVIGVQPGDSYRKLWLNRRIACRFVGLE